MKPENEKEIKIPLEKKKGNNKNSRTQMKKAERQHRKSRKPKFDFLNRLIELINVLLRCLKMIIEGSFYRHCR